MLLQTFSLLLNITPRCSITVFKVTEETEKLKQAGPQDQANLLDECQLVPTTTAGPEQDSIFVGTFRHLQHQLQSMLNAATWLV